MNFAYLLSISVLFFLQCANASVFEGVSLWNKTELKVCFADPKDKNASTLGEAKRYFPGGRVPLFRPSETEKSNIEKIVTQEYTAVRTGIHFVGFQDCSESDRADVYIYIGGGTDRGVNGAAPVGQGAAQDPQFDRLNLIDPRTQFVFNFHTAVRQIEEKPNYVFIRRFKTLTNPSALSESEYLQMTALHEFGHITGLLHENERSEAENDSVCSISGPGRAHDAVENATFYSKYDSGSIMSYCFTYALMNRLGTHFSVTMPSRSETRLKLSEPVIPYPGLSIYDPERMESVKTFSDHVEYRIKISLSKGDVHALQCAYAQDKLEQMDSCREGFNVYAKFLRFVGF